MAKCVRYLIPFGNNRRTNVDLFNNQALKNRKRTVGENKDPVYTVPDSQGHVIKLNTFNASLAFKFMIILQNVITTNHRKSGKSRCRDGHAKLRIRCHVNGVKVDRVYYSTKFRV